MPITERQPKIVDRNRPNRVIARRGLLEFAARAVPAMAVFGSAVRADPKPEEMFGQIAKITAIAGKRDELIAILLAGTSNLLGCLMYVVARDEKESDAIWISEVWRNRKSHEASLSLPSVKRAISRGQPLIASFGTRVSLVPVGGVGLSQRGRR